MEQYKILVSESYHRDLRNIIHYISHSLDAPYTAANLLDEIEKAVKNLAVMPERFALVDDVYLRARAFRKCSVKNYLLFYKVNKERKIVLIHRILHTKQNWSTLL